MFVGRIQPLKAPDVVIRAAADLVAAPPRPARPAGRPGHRRPVGLRPGHTRTVCVELAAALGVDDVVRFVPPVEQAELVDHYRAASVVCVPSYNESFGLVAIEAQACGTPVVAANVGGLPTAVARRRQRRPRRRPRPSGLRRCARAAARPTTASLDAMGRAAPEHAQQFGWARTAAAHARMPTDAAATRCARTPCALAAT